VFGVGVVCSYSIICLSTSLFTAIFIIHSTIGAGITKEQLGQEDGGGGVTEG
jgi:hypothetical protein